MLYPPTGNIEVPSLLECKMVAAVSVFLTDFFVFWLSLQPEDKAK